MKCVIMIFSLFFFFNDTATTEIYTLSLHDALPISGWAGTTTNGGAVRGTSILRIPCRHLRSVKLRGTPPSRYKRSEEHTSELQSRQYLVCRLLLEKKKTY